MDFKSNREAYDRPIPITPLLEGLGGPKRPTTDTVCSESYGTNQQSDPRLRPRLADGPTRHHIRLLRILDERTDGLIYCETRVFPLATSEHYTALSYTWGPPVPRYPILLDGVGATVSTGLWDFLQQARHLNKHVPGPGWLWIDALSINQQDPEERAYQVSIMADIYGTARRVVVWLGPAYDDSDEAMAALSAPVTRFQSKETHSARWEGPAGQGVVNLCERPYWRRLWVFQELRAAHEILMMCGSKIIQCGPANSGLWQLLYDFLFDGAMGATTPQYGSKSIAMHRSPAWDMVKQLKYSKVDRNQTVLWTLLRSTKHLLCANPRDRVYALLSISTSGHKDIRVDYACSVPSLANHLLRNHHSYLRPSSLSEVVDQCKFLEELFGLGHHGMYSFSRSGTHYDMSSLLPKQLEASKLAPKDFEYLEMWAGYYGHTEVCKLLRQALGTWDTKSGAGATGN